MKNEDKQPEFQAVERDGPQPKRRRKSPEIAPVASPEGTSASTADPPPPASFPEPSSDAGEAALHRDCIARFAQLLLPPPPRPKDRARVHVLKPYETHEDRYRATEDVRHAALAVGEAEVMKKPVPTWAMDECLRYREGASSMQVKDECRRRYENHLRVLNRFDDPPKRKVKHERRDAPRLAMMESLVAGATGKHMKPATAARRVAREDAKDGEDENSIVRELIRLWNRESTAYVEHPERKLPLEAIANYRIRDPHKPILLPSLPQPAQPEDPPLARLRRKPGRPRRRQRHT